MIPLSDIDRRPLSLPVMTTSIIGINIIIFVFEMMMGAPFIMRWSFIPSVVLIGFWFIIQLLSGFGSFVQHQVGGVAYMAHIGGFIFGMGFGYLFKTLQRPSQKSE